MLTELGATEPPWDPERIESNENVFFFLGQNNHSAPAEEEAWPIGGYPGHVDKVDYIGTWHVQHRGSKLCDAALPPALSALRPGSQLARGLQATHPRAAPRARRSPPNQYANPLPICPWSPHPTPISRWPVPCQ